MINCVAWNPNGIRSLLKKSTSELKRLIENENPDIIFFIETKGNNAAAAINEVNTGLRLLLPGWEFHHACCVSKPGRHGVSLAYNPIKVPNIRNIFFGFDETSPIDPEGRIIGIDLGHILLYGVYVPNASLGLKRLDFKLEWMKAFSQAIGKQQKPVIVIGDINVAPDERDICNPEQNLKSPGFTIEERKGFNQFITDNNLVDLWRYQNPVEPANKSLGKDGIYTFWNTKSRARERNAGWRIDLCLVSSTLIDKQIIGPSVVHPGYLGSDHCPVSLTFTIENTATK
jgi:exodeoxyribonuclease-3